MTAGNALLNGVARRSAVAFLIGGLLLLVDAILVAANILTGAERYLFLGQAFVGAGWTAGLVGLLGVYPALASRSRWLSRAGAVCAAVGIVTFATMAVAVVVYATGIPPGDYEAISVVFIPGVLVGSVLGFVAFGAASLRSGAHSRAFGVLLFVPAALVLANILRFAAGNESAVITLGIVIADASALLTIGYLRRIEPTNQTTRTAAGPTV